MFPDGEYLLDTGWACGLAVIRGGKVVDCAPIFVKRFRGKDAGCLRSYKMTRLSTQPEKNQKETP